MLYYYGRKNDLVEGKKQEGKEDDTGDMMEVQLLRLNWRPRGREGKARSK